MIVVDTSAIVAIAFAEPERTDFLAVIDRADRVLISSVSVVEARMVVHARRGERAVVLLDNFFGLPMFEIVPPRNRYHRCVERLIENCSFQPV